jgi:hypothetical protein
MPATLTTVGNILKEVYEPDIIDQLDSKTIALKRILKSDKGITTEIGGKYVVFPIRTKRNHGVGSRNEGELLPLPGQQSYNAGRVSLKYQYGGVELTGQIFELANSNFQAFSSALDAEISGLKENLEFDQNRQVYGNNRGTLATVTTLGTGVNTVTALNAAQYIEEGMQVDVIDITTIAASPPTARAADRQVVSYNAATGVITLSGAVFTTAVGDIVVRMGSVNREWTGLASIIQNTGVLYNIDPAVESRWKATVDSNAGTPRPLSEGLMINMVDSVSVAGGDISLIVAGLGVRRSYFNLLNQLRRFTNTQEFTGGFSGLAFTTDNGDIPLVVDKYAPTKSMLFMDESQIKLYQEHEWAWMNRDGSEWQRKIGSGGTYDAYQAYFYKYSEIGTHRRNAHGRIDDLIES